MASTSKTAEMPDWLAGSLSRQTMANDSLVGTWVRTLDGLISTVASGANESSTLGSIHASTSRFDGGWGENGSSSSSCNASSSSSSDSSFSSSFSSSCMFAGRPANIANATEGGASSTCGGHGHFCGGDGAVACVDGLVSRTVFGVLEGLGIDLGRPSPITKDLPFVSSPTCVILSVAVYVLVVVIATRLMKRAGAKPRQKDPTLLRALIIVHNLFLALLSMFMGTGILYQAWRNGFSILGNMYSDQHVTLGKLIYLFYISKLYEFVDTLIMLLKRNLWQVSFLHVYHHGTISFIWWIMSYRTPGGDAYFSAALNSWIHVAMYLYYFLAAILGKDERRRKKYLFWGKYLTIMQMIQFVLFIGQAAYGVYHPETYPTGIAQLLFFYSLSLLIFFGNFYVQKHVAPSRRDSSSEPPLQKSAKVE